MAVHVNNVGKALTHDLCCGVGYVCSALQLQVHSQSRPVTNHVHRTEQREHAMNTPTCLAGCSTTYVRMYGGERWYTSVGDSCVRLYTTVVIATCL